VPIERTEEAHRARAEITGAIEDQRQALGQEAERQAGA
jgi:hypothetical protein